MRQFESDFDKSQSQLRAIASAWSAAFLAAIALITINGLTPLVIPQGAILQPASMGADDRIATIYYLRQVICLIGSVGIFAFWFVDQRVYQRLLHTVFAYGLFMEFKNPDLPQIRSNLFAANLDITSWLGWFYGVQFVAFLFLSGIFMFVGVKPIEHATFAMPIVHMLGVIIGLKVAFCWQSLKNIVDKLYPDLAANWPDWERNDATVGAWLSRINNNCLQRPRTGTPASRKKRR